MLPIAEVHALAAMLYHDGGFDAIDITLVEDLTGLTCDVATGTCKEVLVIGNQWVIKFDRTGCRSGSDDEIAALDRLQEAHPEYMHRFIRPTHVADGVSVQEFVTIDKHWFERNEDAIDEVIYATGVKDVFWRNAGYRADGSWAIFDFDPRY